jgi:hypothetical protein
MLQEIEFDEAIAVEETRLAELDRLSNVARSRLAKLHAARNRAVSRDLKAEGVIVAGTAWSPERNGLSPGFWLLPGGRCVLPRFIRLLSGCSAVLSRRTPWAGAWGPARVESRLALIGFLVAAIRSERIADVTWQRRSSHHYSQRGSLL